MRYEEITVARGGDALPLVHQLISGGRAEARMVYERDGEWCIALGVLGEVRLEAGRIVRRWEDDVAGTPQSARPLSDVARALAELPLTGWTAYGWLGFDYAYLRTALADQLSGQPLLQVIVPVSEIRIGRWQIIIRSVRRAEAQRLRDLLDDQPGGLLAEQVTLPAYAPRPVDVDAGGDRDYQEMVAEALREIRSGRLQKAIVSRRLPLDFPVDLVGTFCLGRAANTPARSFLIDLPGMRATGFSPEIMVAAAPDGRITTNPLAGTRALHGTDEDVRLRAVLLSDPKEIYEHAISVKVACDELIPLCRPRSVAVQEFMTVKPRGSVQHLGSQVSGQLTANRTCWDALEAVFPAVTTSGIPKSAAYRCISRLEPHPRGLYGGAVLIAGSDGSLDAAVALRTLFQQQGTAWLQAGAGIVAASDPAREYQETCEKLRSIAPYIVEQVAEPSPAAPPIPAPPSRPHALRGRR